MTIGLPLEEADADPAATWARIAASLPPGTLRDLVLKWANDKAPLALARPRASCHDLLRAAVGPLDGVLAAWARWRAEDPEARAAGAFPLIPRAYRRAKELGAVEVESARFEGVVRYHVASTAVAARAVSRAFGEFQIPPLLIGGAAVSRLLAEDHASARSLGQIAVMLARDERNTLLGRLSAAGWTVRRPRGGAPRPPHLAAEQVIGLAAPRSDTVRLELHSRASADDPTDEADGALLNGAREEAYLGARVLVPEPSACLSHVLSQGSEPSSAPDIEWAADAALLVDRFSTELDVASVCSKAGARCRTLALWEAARFIHDVLECRGAGALIVALERNPISPAELIAHEGLRLPSPPAPCQRLAQALVQERIAASRERRPVEPERAIVEASRPRSLRAELRSVRRRH